jgi:hypothetical protein
MLKRNRVQSKHIRAKGVLANYGNTEESIGVEILSSLKTVQIGTTAFCPQCGVGEVDGICTYMRPPQLFYDINAVSASLNRHVL